MSDPNIKQITLVSSGASGDQLGGKRRRTAKKKKFELDGGGGTSPGTITQLSASHVPGTETNPVEPVGVNSNLTKVAAPLQVAGKPEPTKVVLAAAKKKSKVVLAAAKPVTPAVKTRKNKTARKVRMREASFAGFAEGPSRHPSGRGALPAGSEAEDILKWVKASGWRHTALWVGH